MEESKERVNAAIKSAGFQSPYRRAWRTLVNLAPADLKKEGSLYDFPIALGFLAATQQIKFDPAGRLFVGELSLDGRLRPVKGSLSFAQLAKEKGFRTILLPWPNVAEASLIKEVDAIGLGSLKETIEFLQGRKEIKLFKINPESLLSQKEYSMDLGWIKGQNYAKRALEIAAAGKHNLLVQGPPGAGKTILAQAIPSILPDLTFDEALEVTKIYSVVGLIPKDTPLITTPPFRNPHHTSSEVALVGGGNPPRVGEITLAHRGVLFMDEFPEFHRDVLESLRQPLEERKITVLRSQHRATFPANFMLVAATNPCPCGYYGDPEKECVCQPSQIAMYRRKLSGPLIDRIDLFVDVPQVKYDMLISPDEENSSQKVRERVEKARSMQSKRFKDEKFSVNSEISIPKIKKYCEIDSRSQGLLRRYVDSGHLSARGYHRVLKVARTIADLEESEKILGRHVSEAVSYRLRDKL